MTPQDFCYWLQGYLELTEGQSQGLDLTQTLIVREHLKLVFDKQTKEIDKLADGLELPVLISC